MCSRRCFMLELVEGGVERCRFGQRVLTCSTFGIDNRVALPLLAV